MKIGKLNILLTSVGRRSYLVEYFKKALNGRGLVHVANSSAVSPAFQCADKTVVTPLIYDENYIPFLLEYCSKNDIRAVIPLFDIDLPILAKNKIKFENIGIKVIVSNYEIVKICNDKWHTYQFLTDKGFDVPKTYLSIAQVKSDIKDGCLNYPLIIKPRWGMGSIGVFQVDNEQELDVLYRKTLNEIKKSYLKYESKEDIECCVLIQEKIDGIEYGLDIINDLNSNYINTVVKRKLSMRSGETDSALTTNSKSLKSIGKKLSGVTKHIANMDVDVFTTASKSYVLEMNARFGGGYPFSHMAGVNLPLAIIKWIDDEECSDILFEKYDVITYKDISLTALNNKSNICEIVCSDIILESINCFEKELNPSLKERNIDINKFCDKLCKFGRVFVYKDIRNENIGLIAGYMNDMVKNTAYISLVSVKSGHQGKGIGSLLLNEFENIAKLCNMKKIRLQVRDYNPRGIDFYRKNGYKITEKNEMDSHFMEKEL